MSEQQTCPGERRKKKHKTGGINNTKANTANNRKENKLINTRKLAKTKEKEQEKNTVQIGS